MYNKRIEFPKYDFSKHLDIVEPMTINDLKNIDEVVFKLLEIGHYIGNNTISLLELIELLADIGCDAKKLYTEYLDYLIERDIKFKLKEDWTGIDFFGVSGVESLLHTE